MAKDTQEIILAAAPDMFSQYGVAGTNIRELSGSFTHVFAGMMEKGLLRKDGPMMLAFAYTAPISALIHLRDREPEKTEETIKQAEAFSRHFPRIDGVPE